LKDSPGWPAKTSDHVEVTNGPFTQLNIDGQALPVSIGPGRKLSFRITRGHAAVTGLIVSSAANHAALLFHRLAELHARVPPGLFPIGADIDNGLHFDPTWTSGFWAGALWQAATIEPAGGMFARWALEATVNRFNPNPPDTHDVGFIYGQSLEAGWLALCRNRAHPPSICPRLKDTSVAAADELLSLAATNPGSGTIPTNPTSPEGVTIIDSMMNIGILTWATRVTHNPVYARLASHHAHVVASMLVRPDGSTAQAVNFDRRTGQVLSIGTHQGLSAASTWSRGQGWAVYGFAQTAAALRDRQLLDVAQRAAGYVAAHLPAGGVPLWDYDAPAEAPLDVSAGVITAAGLLHLASACKQMPGVCVRPGRWVPLARRMLASALALASQAPPIGFLGPQALNEHHRTCWCNHGELIFGLSYALEAVGHGGAKR
jgi:unsaturated chondroitin disaccharide hydrolase